jgi:LacI family transcriptional regulator
MRPSRRSRGTVTIEDVAREAGVSAMTVSRVINGATNVRETTRAAVMGAVERLNYSPNSAARNLAAGEATHIGLLYANPSAAYLSQFLIGALEAARRAGCHLVIESCPSDDPGEQAEATRGFVTSDVEGVILPPPLSESDAILRELGRLKIPMVTVERSDPLRGVPNVRINDFAAAFEMTDYLIGLGHRNIGFVHGHPNQRASLMRHMGYLEAMKVRGLAGAGLEDHGLFTYRSGLEAANRLLQSRRPPTAIFASNDDMAAAAISVAHRRGLSVPGDVSIVGFDDTAPATTVWPELTTVRQPIAAMAGVAVDMMIEDVRIRRDSGSRNRAPDRVMDHELVIRESSGPPPARDA